jgi:hypothetical protein
MNAAEATGDTVAKMLKEIEETGNLTNPYCLSGEEVEQRMAEVRQRMTEVKMNIETVWIKSPIEAVNMLSLLNESSV